MGKLLKLEQINETTVEATFEGEAPIIERIPNNELVEPLEVEGEGYQLDGDKSVEEDSLVVTPTYKYSQWSSVDGCIIPVANTLPRLERGYYEINFSQSLGMYFSKVEVQLNKLYRLPNEATDMVLDDISKFWTLEDRYKAYQRVFRRNYLLYSAPGTGKTSLINLMCQELIEKYDGVVISLSTETQIDSFPDAVRRIRKIEPDRKIIGIIEDIDGFIECSTRLNTLLLNILDGNLKLGGLVMIATTNHIESLENRYINRPSRFNRVIEFPLPNEESRRVFIEKTILPDDLNTININEWVEKTDGYTIDHLNELIQLHFIFGESEESAFETMDKFVGRATRLKNVTSVKKRAIGFEGNGKNN